MPRLVAVMLAAVLGMSTPASEVAWVFLVDDLHISFVHTGRLRDLLRTGARELIRDGDRWLLHASGPSAKSLSNAMTGDPGSIASAIKFVTGNGLKPSDIARAPSRDEVLYRGNRALDAAEDVLTAVGEESAARKAIILVSWGYDVEAFPSLADRIDKFTLRAQESGVTIFAIDSSRFGAEISPAPLVDPVERERYQASSRRSLSLITEGTGGFVIERLSEPLPGLKRINAQMR